MSITDELREYIRREMWDLPKWKDELQPIADSIDAAHRAALEKLAAMVDETNDSHVLLPVDADGMTIHPGDRLYWKDGKKTTPVHIHSLILDECVPRRWDYEYETDNDGEIMDSRECERLTMFEHSIHNYDPTVEDVLREFAARVCNSGHQWGLDAADTIAEFAAKLRLAEGVGQ